MDAGTAAPDPKRPFFVMNPRSGGGKVVRFGLREKAEALGAEVALLEGPGHVDVAALVRDAVDRGADLLGVAGGDGTQALVAGIAAEHDLPFLVSAPAPGTTSRSTSGSTATIPPPAWTGCANGVEVRVDLGMIGDRPFVNNASFGAYARDRAEPGVPGQQGGHDPVDAAGPAHHRRRQHCRSGSATARWTAPRRSWSATTRTDPGG